MNWILLIPYLFFYYKLIKYGIQEINSVQYQIAIFFISLVCAIYFYNKRSRGFIQKLFDKIMFLVTGTCAIISLICFMSQSLLSVIGSTFYFILTLFFNLDKFNGVKLDLPGESFDMIEVMDHLTIVTTNPMAYVLPFFVSLFNTTYSILFGLVNIILNYFGIVINLWEYVQYIYYQLSIILNKIIDKLLISSTLVPSSIELKQLNSTTISSQSSLTEVSKLLYDTGSCWKKNTYSSLFRDLTSSNNGITQTLNVMNSNCLNEAKIITSNNNIKVSSIIDASNNVTKYFKGLFKIGYTTLLNIFTMFCELLVILKHLIVQKFAFSFLKSSSSFLLVNKLQEIAKMMISDTLMSFLVNDYLIVIPAIFVFIVSLVSIVNKQFPTIGRTLFNNRWFILRIMNGTVGFLWLVDLLQRLYLTIFSSDFNLSILLNVGILANGLVLILLAYIDLLIPRSVENRSYVKNLNHFTEDFMLLYICGWLYLASIEIKAVIGARNVLLSCSAFTLIYVIRKEALTFYNIDVIRETLNFFWELLKTSIQLIGKTIAATYKILRDITMTIMLMVQSIVLEIYNGCCAILVLIRNGLSLAYEGLKSVGKFLDSVLKPLLYNLYESICYGIQVTFDYLNIALEAIFNFIKMVIVKTCNAFKYCFESLLWTVNEIWKRFFVPLGKFLFNCGKELLNLAISALRLLKDGLVYIFNGFTSMLVKAGRISIYIFESVCYAIEKTFEYMMNAFDRFCSMYQWIWTNCIIPLGQKLWRMLQFIVECALSLIYNLYESICYGIQVTFDYLNIIIVKIFNFVEMVIVSAYNAIKYSYESLLWTVNEIWKRFFVPLGKFLFNCGKELLNLAISALRLLKDGLVYIFNGFTSMLVKAGRISIYIFESVCYAIEKTFEYMMKVLNSIGDSFIFILKETWNGIKYCFRILLKVLNKIRVCVNIIMIAVWNIVVAACYHLVNTAKIIIQVSVIDTSIWLYLNLLVPLYRLLVRVIVWFGDMIKELARLTVEVLKATYNYMVVILNRSLQILKQVLLFALDCVRPTLNSILCCWFSVSLLVCGCLCLKNAVGDSKLGLLLGGYTNVVLGLIFLCKSILDNVLPPVNDNDQSMRGKAFRLIKDSLNFTLKICLTLYAYLDFYFIPLLTVLTTKTCEILYYVTVQSYLTLVQICLFIMNIGIHIKNGIYAVLSILFDGFGKVLSFIKTCIAKVFTVVIKGILYQFARTMFTIIQSIWNNPFSGLFASLGVILVAYYAHKGLIDFQSLFMLMLQVVGAKQESFLSYLLYLSSMKYYLIELYGYLKSVVISMPSLLSKTIYLNSHATIIDFFKNTFYVIIGAVSVLLKFFAQETKLWVNVTGIEGIATNNTLAWVVYILNVVLLRLLIWNDYSRTDAIENNIYLIRSTMKILFIPVLVFRVLLGSFDLSMIIKSPMYVFIGYCLLSLIMISNEAIRRRRADDIIPIVRPHVRPQHQPVRPIVRPQSQPQPQPVRPQPQPVRHQESKPLSIENFVENIKSVNYIRPNRLFLSNECSICMETFTDDMSNPLPSQVYYLQCGHGLHEGCISCLIEVKKRDTKCPECRCSIIGGRNIFL